MKRLFNYLPTKQRRRLLTLLGTALIFTILGAANTIYGYRKYEQYAMRYQEASSATTLPAPFSEPFLNDITTPGNPSPQLAMIQASVEFYAFVTLGGKYFLAAAGILLLLSLFYLRRTSQEFNH